MCRIIEGVKTQRCVLLLRRRKLTISLAALRGGALANLALLLQIEVPALLLALAVLQVEGDDGLGLLDGILALGGIGLERLVDRVKGGGGGEGIWQSVSA